MSDKLLPRNNKLKELSFVEGANPFYIPSVVIAKFDTRDNPNGDTFVAYVPFSEKLNRADIIPTLLRNLANEIENSLEQK